MLYLSEILIQDMMTFRHFGVIIMAFCFLASCDKNDDDSSSDFYDDAYASASEQALIGVWSIFNVSFENRMADVPANYPDCGRDYFSFSQNSQYTENILKTSNCDYETNNLNWNLENGVLNFRNSNNQTDQWVIISLMENTLTFKARIDVNEDGKLDIVTLYAQRYQSPDIDKVSSTFMKNYAENYQNLISHTWQPYQDVQGFLNYEIYRSVGENCIKENAVLVKTITDVNITEFTDLKPPGEQYLCYYLKTNLKSGLLGESELQLFNTTYLEAFPVNLNQPQVLNNTIALTWEQSNMPYFSHYEITYSNYPSDITGYGIQQVVVTTISDIGVTSFVDENLPYLENPFYNIYVYDIFGHKSFSNGYNTTTSREVNYKRVELLDVYEAFSYAIDPTEPIVYFYGYAGNGPNGIKIYRYNYETNQTEAVTTFSAGIYTELSIEIIKSSYGKEILLDQGGKLQVYNANTLAFKYDLEVPNIFSINDFMKTSSDFWVFTNNDFINTYSRNDSELILKDSKPHFVAHQAMYNYSVFEIEDKQLILGHRYESNSMIYKIDASGNLTHTKTVPVPIKEYEVRKSQYNAAGHYIINFDENRLYSTLNFSHLQSYQQPNFASGISKDGTKILGSNNDPDWKINDDSQHTKEAVILNRTTQQLTKVTTKGYPLIVFEGYNGKIMSISSGLKRENLRQTYNDKADLFIEIVDVL